MEGMFITQILKINLTDSHAIASSSIVVPQPCINVPMMKSLQNSHLSYGPLYLGLYA